MVLSPRRSRWLGGLASFSALVIVFYGTWRGTQQKAGRVTGNASRLLRSALFYFLASALFLGVSYLGWIRIPWNSSLQARLWMLTFGSLLFFSGMVFLLWARLTLGRNYFVSTAMGAQLFAEHQLVTAGPYAIVRYPMYVGLTLAAWGALLLFSHFAPIVNEQALSAEFGDQWRDYCKRVPAFIPKLKR